MNPAKIRWLLNESDGQTRFTAEITAACHKQQRIRCSAATTALLMPDSALWQLNFKIKPEVQTVNTHREQHVQTTHALKTPNKIPQCLGTHAILLPQHSPQAHQWFIQVFADLRCGRRHAVVPLQTCALKPAAGHLHFIWLDAFHFNTQMWILRSSHCVKPNPKAGSDTADVFHLPKGRLIRGNWGCFKQLSSSAGIFPFKLPLSSALRPVCCSALTLQLNREPLQLTSTSLIKGIRWQ